LGMYIVYRSPGGIMSARIVEVEAYIGRDDPACHAAAGPTRRNRVMFGPPGFSYIYFIYGMYHCLNFVTEAEGFPAAVLLRAAEPCDGLETMLSNSGKRQVEGLLGGPGKFCRAFGLTRAQNGLDLTGDQLFLEDRGEARPTVARSPRVGVTRAARRQWRFQVAGPPKASGG